MVLIAVFVSLVFLYSLVSRRLERTVITAPIVFTAAGILTSRVPEALSELGLDRHGLLLIAEVGLVMTLFTDAAHINLGVLTGNRRLPLRLLGTGMLLTILLGAIAALVVLDGLSLWEAGILAAILAPTDAGLGQVIVNSPRVPMRIRQALNVEAGLNDGLSVPFLMFFIALALESTQGAGVVLTRFLGEQLGFGTLAGLGVGLVGGWLLGLAHRRDWMAAPLRQLGLVALPLFCVLASEATRASMFIAAFLAGLAVQVGFKEAGRHSGEFAEDWGQLLNYFVFFLFGLLAAGFWAHFNTALVLYAVLSLTVVRMVPVALALIRHRTEHPDRAVHGVVRAEGAGVHRARSRLPGAASELAWPIDDPARGDCDGAAQHRCARAQRIAGNRSLCPTYRVAGLQRVRASSGAGVDDRHWLNTGKGDGKLTVEEFLNARFRLFDLGDTTGDGVLTLQEVETYVNRLR